MNMKLRNVKRSEHASAPICGHVIFPGGTARFSGSRFRPSCLQGTKTSPIFIFFLLCTPAMPRQASILNDPLDAIDASTPSLRLHVRRTPPVGVGLTTVCAVKVFQRGVEARTPAECYSYEALRFTGETTGGGGCLACAGRSSDTPRG